ncbi:MAG: hypothetical protein OXF23_01200 [Candidatus Dadabacteria bacterium]|nr:hypothetical protein [Candidatus Dadabacteria bacterium]MCY4263194.1 hypothetical protein [Candidatus Dadabacteria bacterium]
MRLAIAVFLALFFIPCFASAQILLPSVASSIKKIPIAVAVLKSSGDLSVYGKNFTDVLKSDLTNAALFDVRAVSILFSSSLEDVDFEYLNAQKTRYLVSGNFNISPKEIFYELIVYDVPARRERMRRKYMTSAPHVRSAAHRFAGELMKELTGLKGFFESEIVFVRKEGNESDLFIMDYDGHNAKKLTNHGSSVLSPDCSSDGSRVIFSSDKNWDHDIYLLGFKATRLPAIGKRITRGIHLDSSPSWSPDGKHVAFSRDGEIYIASSSGEVLRRLTKSPAIDVSPTWSPDGEKIAFVSDRAGTPDIYVMSSEGGLPARITSGGYNTDPVWSPNASVNRIAFVKVTRSRADIYTVGPDGKGKQRLTSSGRNEHPTWSPDGYYITFSSKRRGQRQIYIMYLNGENKLPLSRGKNDSFSTWCVK